MYNNLPPSDFSFSIDLTGEESGQSFKGDFTLRKLTVLEKVELIENWIAHRTTELQKTNPDTPITDTLYSYYRMLAVLRFGVVSCPDWWKESDFGLKLHDMNVIFAIFGAKRDAEAKWIEAVKEKALKVKPSVDSEEFPQQPPETDQNA